MACLATIARSRPIPDELSHHTATDAQRATAAIAFALPRHDSGRVCAGGVTGDDSHAEMRRGPTVALQVPMLPDRRINGKILHDTGKRLYIYRK